MRALREKEQRQSWSCLFSRGSRIINRILIIEDEEEIKKVLVCFLEKKGFEVISVSNGRKGLDVLDSEQGRLIDLLVLDIKMPDISGIDVIENIRKTGKDLPILVLTGSIDRNRHIERLERLNYPLDDILQKPVDLYKLLSRIKQKLNL